MGQVTPKKKDLKKDLKKYFVLQNQA